ADPSVVSASWANLPRSVVGSSEMPATRAPRRMPRSEPLLSPPGPDLPGERTLVATDSSSTWTHRQREAQVEMPDRPDLDPSRGCDGQMAPPRRRAFPNGAARLPPCF